MKKILQIISPLLFIIHFSCSRTENHYPVKGTILELYQNENKIKIAHDTIPELMMPMQMDFYVPDLKEFDDIKIGDSVHFKFIWDDDGPYAKNIKIVGKGHIPNNDDWFFEDEDFLERGIGDTLDDVTLLNLDSIEVKLNSFGKEYYFISFIFSRCPMPNMCPAVVLKNKALIDSFSDQNNIHFLLISFDYFFDTPSVLKNHYDFTLSDYKNIDVLSSYKKAEEIYMLGKQSGCEFWGIEKNKIGHTMQSILINKELKILGKWPGEDWKVKMAKNSIRFLLENKI